MPLLYNAFAHIETRSFFKGVGKIIRVSCLSLALAYRSAGVYNFCKEAAYYEGK